MEGMSVGEMEARKELNSPPNHYWPNHHREFFAFGKEKRDELCVRSEKPVFVCKYPTRQREEMMGGGTNQMY